MVAGRSYCEQPENGIGCFKTIAGWEVPTLAQNNLFQISIFQTMLLLVISMICNHGAFIGFPIMFVTLVEKRAFVQAASEHWSRSRHEPGLTLALVPVRAARTPHGDREAFVPVRTEPLVTVRNTNRD